MEQNLADQEASVEHGWEVVRKVSGIVLLGSDPVLDEVGSLHERSKIIECLYKLLIGLLGDIRLVVSVLRLIGLFFLVSSVSILDQI